MVVYKNAADFTCLFYTLELNLFTGFAGFFGGIIRTLCTQDHFISRDNFTSSFLILIWVLLKLQGSWLSACTSVTAEVPRRVDTAVEAGVRGQGSDQGRTAGEMSVQLMHDGRASRKCSELAFCSLKFQKPGTVLLVGALQP